MRLLLPSLITFGALLGACGPINSGALILEAQRQLVEAQAAGAETYAPYEYYSSDACLWKAREEMGYSQYERSVSYAEQALAFAREALALAKERSAEAGEILVPGVAPPPLPPASDYPTSGPR